MQQVDLKRKPLMGISPSRPSTSAIPSVIQHNRKPPETRELISTALKSHFLFSFLDKEMEDSIIDSMDCLLVSKGTNIIIEGNMGDNCYVIESGEFCIYEKSKGNAMVNKLGPGELFGELALLYNCPCSATVQSSMPSKVWVLDRAAFRAIVAQLSEKESTNYQNYLKNLNCLKSLTEEQLASVAEVVRIEEYKADDILVSPDTKNFTIYIVQKGTAKYKDRNGKETELKEEDSFGEECLQHKNPTYTVRATSNLTCIAVHYNDFVRVIGDIGEVIDHNNRLKALLSIPLLQYLSYQELEQLDEAFVLETYTSGSYIIRQGEIGDKFYILHGGICDVTKTVDKDGQAIEQFIRKIEDEGSYFGELALYSQDKRTANVIAVTTVTCYTLDRQSFIKLFGPLKDIMGQHSVTRTLRSVPLFRSLSNTEIESLAHALRRRKYVKGEYLIEEGTAGNEFFIISEGCVNITKNTSNGQIGIGKCGNGSYLGEIALVTNDLRTANAIAETEVDVFVLGAKEFSTLFAPILVYIYIYILHIYFFFFLLFIYFLFF